jgi:DNA polymerase I-like protein with 3'-5' exonuclease and polymerase domains
MIPWEDIPTPRNLSEFYRNYELPLARAFHAIEKRGVFTDASKLEDLRKFLLSSLEETAAQIECYVGRHVAFSSKHAGRLGWDRKDYVNLSYPGDVRKILEAKGFTLPYNRATGSRTTGEDALNALYSQSGDEIILKILQAREYTKILGTYVEARLHNGILYSSYSVTGTVSGRRSARKNIFGYGTNHQNLPKHSHLGKKFRECIRARPGRLLLGCDQEQAEDWIVNAIIAAFGGDSSGLEELRQGIDRHRRLASRLFTKPESTCGKDTPERFMGKKTRHAGNYDMGPEEMARQMVKEGHTGIPVGLCSHLLEMFHRDNPGIRGVFHKYVQDELSKSRLLRTPLGRERIFLGCRPFSDNRKVYKEAYSFIPQGTVGDNTGFSILFCERNDPGLVVLDTHDAITLEIDDNPDCLLRGVRLLERSFDRHLQIGDIEVKIPVELEVGYDLGHMTSFKNTEEDSIRGIYKHILGNIREVHPEDSDVLVVDGSEA